jgi:GT2 family glycosyltransferase
LVQGKCRVPGFELLLNQADLTAAAGPVLAVDRQKFLELGGYDPVFYPGRIEDLDLGFRGWMAGYKGYYVPRSVAYHRGFGTFGPVLGRKHCDRLAIRNSLLFAWKNLAGARLADHLCWLPVRLCYWLLRGRLDFAMCAAHALLLWSKIRSARKLLAVGEGSWVQRQEAFFQRFEW